ncbi:MAG: iron chelate uptake ABC transporter family permease subunit [Chloroflexi bacterium]|nr:iron chelate uptake ABC transporter family permease subunit [Chloroflexota bacterium]MBI3740562.1 iron chelate uptake ABC transporter family permease subunit [Chloroflexota bacterium]
MRPKTFFSISILIAILLAALFLATSLGTVSVSVDRIGAIILKRVFDFSIGIEWSESQEAIIWQLRLPRVLSAALVGGALAVAGVLFQGLLRNPMADPYLLGTSAGAALAATIALFLPASLAFFGFSFVALAAFSGALAAVLLVYRLARIGVRTPITTLLLAGFAASSMMAAAMSFLMLWNQNTLQRVILWTMGGVSANGWDALRVIAPLVLSAILIAYALAFDLNAFLLGEEQAAAVGVAVEQKKFLVLGIGALLTGAAVSISGLVGFVGLIVPHVVRLILGPNHRLLIPASVLSGAIFLVLADLIARLVLAPSEVPLGIITALVGAPFFIYLLRKSKKEYTF